MGWEFLGPFKYYRMAYFIPFLVAASVYGFIWLTSLGGFSASLSLPPFIKFFGVESNSLPIDLLIYGTFGILFASFFTLGEELGWRGLLVPELIKITTFNRTALITGLIWAGWHYPLIIFVGLNVQGTSLIYSLCVFTITVILFSYIFTWIRLKSGSLWPVVLLHATTDIFSDNIFGALTVNYAITPYMTSLGLIIAYGAVAYYFYRRQPKVSDRAN